MGFYNHPPSCANITYDILGVLDAIPLSNFPDVRKSTMIQSKSSGNIQLEPREGRLVRVYVQLKDEPFDNGVAFDKSTYSPEKIVAIAQEIIFPFTFDSKQIKWWSAYRIKQQVANQMDVFNRVFIAGDAVRE